MDELLKLSTKIQNQKYMTAIKNGFTIMLPLIIIGSFVHCLQILFVQQKKERFIS